VHPEVQRLKDENARLRSRIDQLEAALADAKETQPVTSASPERPRNGRRR
jgi:BMFP domain-containing protein YqiC